MAVTPLTAALRRDPHRLPPEALPRDQRPGTGAKGAGGEARRTSAARAAPPRRRHHRGGTAAAPLRAGRAGPSGVALTCAGPARAAAATGQAWAEGAPSGPRGEAAAGPGGVTGTAAPGQPHPGTAASRDSRIPGQPPDAREHPAVGALGRSPRAGLGSRVPQRRGAGAGQRAGGARWSRSSALGKGALWAEPSARPF
ncbi:circumsporozoite protein-like [Molothrus ater]|uniref:circumsporozoite protein-like n=1 Tax=Molothrus ater TaxID=84834 RepID=UPI0023E89B88|nr:circumsporozoite protein-like [Molothrus ater]XP_054371434.1 circumsporozoite protein-like [Molothrus ater]